MQNFYVILPSNSSLDIYPENCANKYTVEFTNAIELSLSKQCALFDIIFPTSYSKSKKYNAQVVYCRTNYAGGQTLYMYHWSFKSHLIIDFEFQASTSKIEDFIVELNDEIEKHLPKEEEICKRLYEEGDLRKPYSKTRYIYKKPKIKFVKRVEPADDTGIEISSGFIVDANNYGVILYLKFDSFFNKIFDISLDQIIPDYAHRHNDLLQLMHNTYSRLYLKDDKYFIDFSGKSDSNIQKLENEISLKKLDFYIICDVVCESYCNEYKRRILKHVNYDCVDNSTIDNFNLKFLTCDKSIIKSISIEILDECFKTVKFQKGITVVTLFFVDK